DSPASATAVQPPLNAQENTPSSDPEAAMLTRIFALTLALLTITAAPAHANFIRNLDADVNLNFGPSEQLTGEMPINVIPPTAFVPFPHTFLLTAHSRLNGTPLIQLPSPP